MEQEALSQRINFLAETLSGSVRGFGMAINEKPTNTSNYATGRNRPPADFLAKIITHFPNINSVWLLTGEGEPFLADKRTGIVQTGNFNQAGTSNRQVVKGNVIGTNYAKGNGNIQGNTNIGGYTSQPLERSEQAELAAAQAEIANLKSQLESANQVIATKDALLASKDEIISLLRGGYNRPN